MITADYIFSIRNALIVIDNGQRLEKFKVIK